MNNSFNNWRKYYKLNYYYHYWIEKTVLELIPRNSSIIEFGCRGGELLSKLPNKIKGNIFISGAYAWYTKEARERTIQKWTDSIISCTKGMPINVVK